MWALNARAQYALKCTFFPKICRKCSIEQRKKNHFPIDIFFDEWRRAWVWEGERKAEASSHSPTLQKEKKNGFRLYRFIVLFSSSSLSSCSCWQRSFNAHGLISSWYCFRFLFISIHIHKQYTVSVRICCMNANEPKKDEAKKAIYWIQEAIEWNQTEFREAMIHSYDFFFILRFVVVLLAAATMTTTVALHAYL